MYYLCIRRDTLVPDLDWRKSQGRCTGSSKGAQGCQDDPQSLADGSTFTSLHVFAYLASVMSVGEGAANCNIVFALVVSNAQCNGILVVRYLSRPSYVLVLKTLLCLPASIC